MNRREMKRFMWRVLATMLEEDDMLFSHGEDREELTDDERDMVEEIRPEIVAELRRRGGGMAPRSRSKETEYLERK